MQARVSWSGIGRCALLSTAVSALTFLGGCSSGVSRFDFPSFGLARSENAPLADPNTTASLPPIPQESVYAQAGSSGYQSGAAPNGYQSGAYSRSNLPPVAQPYNQPTPAAYSPGSASLKPESATYAPPPAPRSNLAKVRAAAETGGETYKVQAGDTPRAIAQKTGVSERALIERNNIDPTHLRIGQVIYLPKGGKASAAPRAVAVDESKPTPAQRSAPDVHVVKTTPIQAPGSQSASKTQAKPAVAGSDEVIGGQNPQVASVQQLPARSHVGQQLPLAGAGPHHLRVRH